MKKSQESTAFKSSQWKTKSQIKTTPKPLETSWKCSVNPNSFPRTDSRPPSPPSWSTLEVMLPLKWFWTASSSHSRKRAICRGASILLRGISSRLSTSLSRAIFKTTRSASNSSSFSESTLTQTTPPPTWAIVSFKALAQTLKSSAVKS